MKNVLSCVLMGNNCESMTRETENAQDSKGSEENTGQENENTKQNERRVVKLELAFTSNCLCQ